MSELVSVVVPIYNVEKYLDRCVSSIVNQTYRNLEVILVDDGSPDNCPQLCDEWQKRDPRIKVIHKKNAGLGMARNTGIDNATGEYICFFDSDDHIALDTIEACVTAARKYNAELVIFGHDDVTPEGRLLRTHIPTPPKQLFCGEEVRNVLLPKSICSNQQMGENWNIEHCAWNKLYSMSLIRKTGWRFASEREIISEDFYSLTVFYGHLNRVYVLDKAFYHYTVNQSSLSRSYRADRFQRIRDFYNAMRSLGEEMSLSEVLDQPIKIITFGFCLGAMKMLVASNQSFRKRFAELRKIIGDECLQEIVRTTDYQVCGRQKKLFYTATKYKLAWLCFLLVLLKNKQDAK